MGVLVFYLEDGSDWMELFPNSLLFDEFFLNCEKIEEDHSDISYSLPYLIYIAGYILGSVLRKTGFNLNFLQFHID